jgi:chemotaxis protein MotB
MASRSRRSRRRRHDGEHERDDSERWLVTYADMLTLLMVLFIVLFAMSQVDEKKYSALRSGLAEGFGGSTSIMQGSDSFLEERPEETSPDLVTDPLFQTPAVHQPAVLDVARREFDRLDKVRQQLEETLRRHGLSEDVQMSIEDQGLVVSLVSRHVVFGADVAELSPRGQRVVDVLAPVLRDLPDPLRIDGHTNQVQVRPAYYDTDWDLSAARAVTVLRRLDEVGGVPEERLSVAAFGHERPLVDPSRPGSQRVNKRVDIVVLSPISEESRDLLDEVARTPGDEGATS